MVNAIEVLRHRQREIPAVAGQAVDLLAGEVERFRTMLLDLLEISRSDEDVDDRAMEPIDLAILVAKVRETSHMTFPLVVATPPPAIYADRRRLVRVVANLLDNAERHGGGVAKVTVTRRQGRARLEVDDAGPGVPVEHREQVFERFARGGHAGERGGESGSGLGLALVARHVRLHSGAVWVEDAPGGGARFVVELPAADDEAGHTESGPSTAR
jgi:signal transduction histidine kinase